MPRTGMFAKEDEMRKKRKTIGSKTKIRIPTSTTHLSDEINDVQILSLYPEERHEMTMKNLKSLDGASKKQNKWLDYKSNSRHYTSDKY
jgi:ATP-dependent exoDNAse (exonuclease V) alpha subunit